MALHGVIGCATRAAFKIKARAFGFAHGLHASALAHRGRIEEARRMRERSVRPARRRNPNATLEQPAERRATQATAGLRSDARIAAALREQPEMCIR
jgi:hypothetical protein